MNQEANLERRWRDFLSYGYRLFSEALLTPGIAIVLSPDLSKMIVIGADQSGLGMNPKSETTG